MLSEILQETLRRALVYAGERGHEFATLEHLLLSLTDDEDALKVLRACDVDPDDLAGELREFIDKELTSIQVSGPVEEPQPTASFHRVFRRAVLHMQSAGKGEATGANVLIALYQEKESHAVYMLQQRGMSRLDAVNFVSHGISKVPGLSESRDVMGADSDLGEGPEGGSSPKSALASYCHDLNQKARDGKIDPLIGRGLELERTIQVLCRRTKNNPLYVGDPGVGKTAIAEGLARKIVEGDVPEVLENAEIFTLDMGLLLAGTRYRGDFEERLSGVLKEIQDKDHAILFIDEIHTIVGAGATSGGSMDASNLLKPALASGDLKTMGSTTYKEFRNYFEKDRGLARRFQKIDVNEPTVEDAVKILRGLKSTYEEHHGLKFSNEAIRSAVELSARHITDRKLPDKAIDVLDEAGASQMLVAPSKRKKMLGVKEIEAVVSKIARIPPKSVSKDDKLALKTLDQNLKTLIYGQDKAIDTLSDAMKLSRAGLREGEKPIGSFLFSGPTGVGKTEVTRQLAFTLGLELHRFDMSEYSERHTVSRLIGAPPGYVGFDQGGLLTDAVDKTPHSVVLLDEIEKAHPEIFNILLQVMDHGTLTDQNGKKVDFRNVILIMTTNAGAAEMSKSGIGFNATLKADADEEAINRLFTPEFRNRLDAIVPFAPLDEGIIEKVVDKFVLELENQLADRNVTISLTPAAKQELSVLGFDPAMGARPLSRVIQDKIKKPLANELLFGKLASGGEVIVDFVDGEFTFDVPMKKIGKTETRTLPAPK